MNPYDPSFGTKEVSTKCCTLPLPALSLDWAEVSVSKPANALLKAYATLGALCQCGICLRALSQHELRPCCNHLVFVLLAILSLQRSCKCGLDTKGHDVQGACGYGTISKDSYPYWSVAALSLTNSFSVAGPAKACGECFEIKCVDIGGPFAVSTLALQRCRSVTARSLLRPFMATPCTTFWQCWSAFS